VLDVAHRGPLGDQVHGQDVAGVDVGWNVRRMREIVPFLPQ
jgi:hypothetical protein